MQMCFDPIFYWNNNEKILFLIMLLCNMRFAQQKNINTLNQITQEK